MDYTVYIFFGIAIFYILNSFKIAQEQERFACFTVGRFMGFKGPGLVFKFSGRESEWIRLKMGDRGELLNDDIAIFHEKAIPVISSSKIAIGSIVQITGFDLNKVKIELSPNQSKCIKCPKCGHGFTI